MDRLHRIESSVWECHDVCACLFGLNQLSIIAQFCVETMAKVGDDKKIGPRKRRHHFYELL